MKGENYWLNGCMVYLAECLGLNDNYNYQFFNCYFGGSVTQEQELLQMMEEIRNEKELARKTA